jgi:GH15 family glucan-1,4-alpha-glucosidase
LPYQPIENYGVIGDLRTAALIGKNGSLDWLCLPHFDSPSVFAALLDDAKGGRFRIAPTCEDVTTKQLYWPDTNILVTRFLSPEGVAELVDFMPVGGEQGSVNLFWIERWRAMKVRFGRCCHKPFRA